MTKWLTSDWTVGQLNALVKKIGSENARGILDDTVEFAVTARAHEFLRPAGEAVLSESTNPFNPNQYFQTRKGLYVWDGFKSRVLSGAKPTNGLAEMSVGSFDLVKSANDAEIRSELPEGHVFEDVSEFSAALAQMIDQQPAGEKGNLLANGYWNVFYVRGGASEVSAVRVYWVADVREWSVNAASLADVRWDEGNRVLSRNC